MSKSSAVDMLEAYRKQTGNKDTHKVTVTWRERIIVFLIVTQLIFTVWVFGGVKLWTNYVNIIFSGVTFLFLFVPFFYKARHFGIRSSTPGENFKLLFKFPVFWFGLLLMIYISIQGFNVSDVFGTDGILWWLIPVSYIEWLPSGFDTPIGGMSPWRTIIMLGAPWLMICTIWVGIRHRRSIRILFVLMCVNNTILAIVAVAQKMTGAKLILWRYGSEAQTFWGTFINGNHGAVFLYLGITVSLSLYFYYFEKSKRKMSKNSFYIIFLGFGIIMSTSSMYALSRGSILAVFILFSMILPIYCIFLYRLREFGVKLLPNYIVVVLIIIFSVKIFNFFDSKLKEEKITHSFSNSINFENSLRYHLYQATWKMIKDNWIFGYGAGSYRYQFPYYQRKYFRENNLKFKYNVFVRFAHNDYLHYLSELGIVGCSFIFLSFLYFSIKYFNKIKSIRFHHTIILVGCSISLLHALIEFHFFNPAVLFFFSLLLVGNLKLLELRV